MEWRTWPDASGFLGVAEDLLRARTLENQIPLGLALRLSKDPTLPPAHLHTVHDADGACLGAVAQTPPYSPALSYMTPTVAEFAASRFGHDHPDTRGAFGPSEAVDAFVAVLRGGSNAPILTQGMALHVLDQVAPVPRPVGFRRAPDAGDEAILQGWLCAFHAEAVPNDPPIAADAGARAIARGQGHLWVTDEPVCYASFGRELGGYVSIGPVYTPFAHRGHGYATALVAEMSALALASGHVGCTLFTDTANPTSNRIYARIGYRRIGEMKRVMLG